MELLYILLGIISIIAVPWTILHWIGRINEQLNVNRTRRRYNDFVEVYWDYNHKCWVNKPSSNLY